jgi:hypothetical protein
MSRRKEDTMADFIFRVDSVHLTEEQQEKIAAAIQGSVLTELAKLDLHGESKTKASAPPAGGPGGGTFLFSPILWRGGWIIPPGEVGSAAGSNFTVVNRATEKNKAA